MPSFPADSPRVGSMKDLLHAIYDRQQFPRVSGLRVHRAVPYGHYHPQWDTRGRLWIWVSKDAADEVPKAEPRSADIILSVLPPSLTGIPVYEED